MVYSVHCTYNTSLKSTIDENSLKTLAKFRDLSRVRARNSILGCSPPPAWRFSPDSLSGPLVERSFSLARPRGSNIKKSRANSLVRHLPSSRRRRAAVTLPALSCLTSGPIEMESKLRDEPARACSRRRRLRAALACSRVRLCPSAAGVGRKRISLSINPDRSLPRRPISTLSAKRAVSARQKGVTHHLNISYGNNNGYYSKKNNLINVLIFRITELTTVVGSLNVNRYR